MATNNELNESSTGIQSKTTGGTFNGRTITGTANQISISNGDGTGGNPTASLTSTIQVSGISFDSGSNTLGNYATGTFVPTLTGASSNPTVTYTVQVGRYTRIGNRVSLNYHITISAYSGGSGNLQVSTLPFTSEATSNSNLAFGLYFANTTVVGTFKWGNTRINSGNAVSLFSFSRDNGGAGTFDTTAPTATSDFVGSIIYEV